MIDKVKIEEQLSQLPLYIYGWIDPKALEFSGEDLVVLGVPVYAGRVPNLLLPYVRDSIRGSGTPAVPVVLYGNRNFDDGLMELR